MRIRTLGVLSMAAAALLLTSCAVQTAPTGDAPEEAQELTTVPGFDMSDGVIHVGQMTALSGPLAPSSNEQVAGQQAYYDIVNAEGGIAGEYPVEVITADNQYNPQLAVQEYQRIKDQVVMLSGVLGDASTEALLPILEQDDAVALPSTQSSRFTKQPNLGMTFTSYQSNTWNTLSYLFEEGQITTDSTVCSMIQADQSGEARQIALEYASEELGFTLGPKTEFAPTDTAFTAQVQTLKNAQCEVVVFGGATNNVPNLVAAATQLDYAPVWLAEFFAIAQSFKDTDIAGYLAENFLITGLAGNLDDTSIEGIELLTEQLGTTPTMQNVYGFMQAITASTILEKAVELGDLSGPGIMNAMVELDKVSYLGLNGDMTYGPAEDRLQPDTSSIFAYDPAAPGSLSALATMYVAPDGRGPDF
ncbi:ABC transporter substrate-binding protein [Microbacterium sp. CFH 90308]|uniref:ABC transporter substrate-binding protein n=1 Tax=Microbacterium salsuginis TaxID=2722803 RepID=A0ABX1KC07_9MICO|nr:ABC transporter substrate-binding protein [Microbacterium sp. CFH 90308]